MAKIVDIGGMPELVRLAEEVRTTNEPRVLRRGDEDLALLVPVAPPGRPHLDPGAAKAALDEAIGSWADLDVDAVVAHVYRARAEGSRPADRP